MATRPKQRPHQISGNGPESAPVSLVLVIQPAATLVGLELNDRARKNGDNYRANYGKNCRENYAQ